MEDNQAEKKQQRDEQYNKYVKQVTPTHNLWLNMAKAFLVGGVICVLGQALLNYFTGIGMDKETAGSWCSLILVALSVFEIWRGRNFSAHHGFCKFSSGICN